MLYDFRCEECGHVLKDVSLPMSHEKSERPRHCGKQMDYYITRPPSVHWKHFSFDAFPLQAAPGAPIVSSHREREEIMARNGLVDANDMTPPTLEEEKKIRKETQESIDQISKAPEGVDVRQLDIV